MDYNPPVNYTFHATYEYEGLPTAQMITNTIKKDFLFPCWVQRFTSEECEEGKNDKIHSYLNMLDSRTFKLNENTQ